MSTSKILFVTTSSLATNPRLVKELRLARTAYQCHCIYFRIGGWSDPIDKQLEQELSPVTFTRLSATRKPFLPWLFAILLEKAAQKLSPILRKNKFLAAAASNRRSLNLSRNLRQMIFRPDLIIGHNLGTLYPIWKFAQKMDIPFGFDMEDFYPGERIGGTEANREQRRRSLLLQQQLPCATYISAASPLIARETDRLLRGKAPEAIVVNNAFFSDEFDQPGPVSDTKLRIVWFSQNIDFGRGLENFIEVLDKYKDKLSLTLIGNRRPAFEQQYVVPYLSFIEVEQPLSQRQLHRQLGAYDIGLAIEDPSADLNKDICLSNKIFAYAQAGLFILATNTSGQEQFINQNPILGQITSFDRKQISTTIERLILLKDDIRAKKGSRFQYAQRLSFEEEGHFLLDKWNEVLNGNYEGQRLS